jgi:MFS family permease
MVNATQGSATPVPARAGEIAGKVWPVVRVAAGNCLEMYDFQIFGYYAAAIAATFFPSASEYASLMASLTTFGAGFLMRPLGAILLGAHLDHRGRRAGLLLTLSLMAIGTLSISCTPSYMSIGLLAPLLVLAGRLIQGLSAGAENGGVSVYLSEIAIAGHKGFYVSCLLRLPRGRPAGLPLLPLEKRLERRLGPAVVGGAWLGLCSMGGMGMTS